MQAVRKENRSKCQFGSLFLIPYMTLFIDLRPRVNERLVTCTYTTKTAISVSLLGHAHADHIIFLDWLLSSIQPSATCMMHSTLHITLDMLLSMCVWCSFPIPNFNMFIGTRNFFSLRLFRAVPGSGRFQLTNLLGYS